MSLISKIASSVRRFVLAILHAIGAAYGYFLYLVRSRRQYGFSRINIELCNKQLRTEKSYDCLISRSLREFGKLMFEVVFMWMFPWVFKDKSVRNIYGEELLREHIANGQSVLLVSPHLGNWEVFNLYLGRFKTISTYKPVKYKAVDAWIKWARESTGSRLEPINQCGIRSVCCQLRSGGGVVMTLADQVPDGSAGRTQAPFFGVIAWTGTMVSRLAQQKNVKVVFGFARRLPNANGFDIHLLPAPDDIYSSDVDVSVCALNEGIENLIRISPEQYLWQYKRFKGGLHPELYYKERSQAS